MDLDISITEDVAPTGGATEITALSTPEVWKPSTNGQPRSLARRAFHGSVWTIVGYGGSQVIRFATNVVLARLLFPRAFGLMALINVLMQGLQMFSDLGIGPAIIKHTHTDDPKFFNTAWTMQVIRGFVLWLVGCALAVPVARFYGTPMLATMIPVAALTALISGFNSTKLFIEGRDLRLGRVIAIELVCQLGSVMAMLLLARFWGSVWALVLGGLVGTLLKTVLSHIALPGMKNRLCWDRESAHHLYHFGRWIFVSTLFTFLAMQIDRLLLPLLTSIEVLGIYSIALGLISIGVGVFEQFANRILMPVTAHCRRNSHHLFNEVVSNSRKYILSMAMVAVANMILLAPAFFYLLYDFRYQGAGFIARWLGFGLWFTLLQRTSQASLLALGHSKVLALANATNFLITIICAPIGFQLFGIQGFIVGWTLGNFVAAIIVDTALAKDGIPLLRQDAVLTAGLIVFVGIGLAIRETMSLHGVWTADALIIKLVSSAVLTLVSAGILYWEYRRSPMTYTGAFKIERNRIADVLPGDAVGSVSSVAGNGVNGKPMNDVVYRD